MKSFVRVTRKERSGNNRHDPVEKASSRDDAAVSKIEKSLEIEYGQQ